MHRLIQVIHFIFSKILFLFAAKSLITGSILFASSNVLAGTTEDVLEGSGQLGTFAIDVVEDFGLEGKSAEESGKARLEGFLKGKATGFIKDSLTGGDDLSEGMGLILNKIFDGINAKKTGGPCKFAALNQAWGIAFDAKHTRLLRGAANIWFDVLTSIPGAPALAEKLVEASLEQAAKDLYKKLRSELEKKIKDAWAKQKDEAFKLTKKSGPCSISMTVLWNKKKNKYLFLITGTCDCKPVATGKGGSIAMKSFEVIGGGTITPKIDLKDPKNPKVKLSVGSASNIKVNANCNCAIDDTRLPPPPEETWIPPEDPIKEWITAPRLATNDKSATCEICQPLLDTANSLVKDFNNLADQMDALSKEIIAERFDTEDRKKNIADWEAMSKRQEVIQAAQEKAFNAYATCEDSPDCKLGSGAIRFKTSSEISEQWTDCKDCIPLMEKVNPLIQDYNNKVGILNGLANNAANNNLEFGTADGIKAYKEWNKLKSESDALKAKIQPMIDALSACKAKKCPGTRWQSWVKTRPISGTCTPCISFQESYNEEVKKYNVVIDKLNALQKKQKEYVEEYGDAWGKGLEGLDKINKEGGLRQLLKDEREGRAKLDAIKRQLDDCVGEKCRPGTSGDKIKIGNDFEIEPDDGGATSAGGIGSFGTGPKTGIGTGGGGITAAKTGTTTQLPGKISTNCTPCNVYVNSYNETVDKIKDLQTQLKADVKKQEDARKKFDALAEKLTTMQFPIAGEWKTREGIVPVLTVGTITYYPYGGNSAKDALESAKKRTEQQRDEAQAKLVEAAAKVKDLQEQIANAQEFLKAIALSLTACEQQCARILIINVINLLGNFPYDRLNPISQEGGSGSAGGPTVLVINNIPIIRLSLAGIDACPASHYHGNANNCNGVFTTDPDSGGCGHGTVSQVIAIPVSSCPDL